MVFRRWHARRVFFRLTSHGHQVRLIVYNISQKWVFLWKLRGGSRFVARKLFCDFSTWSGEMIKCLFSYHLHQVTWQSTLPTHNERSRGNSQKDFVLRVRDSSMTTCCLVQFDQWGNRGAFCLSASTRDYADRPPHLCPGDWCEWLRLSRHHAKLYRKSHV